MQQKTVINRYTRRNASCCKNYITIYIKIVNCNKRQRPYLSGRETLSVNQLASIPTLILFVLRFYVTRLRVILSVTLQGGPKNKPLSRIIIKEY